MKKVRLLRKILFFFLCTFWAAFTVVGLVVLTEKAVFYPLSEYKDEIISAAERYDIDKALVFAIVKTESGFDKDAVSDKGAVGLMQMTERTAEYVARLRGIENYDIIDAATNIDFGCYYYKYLENRFGDMNVSLAAYNAGEGKVSGWLKDKRYSSDGKTLDITPIEETDEYVVKVNKSFRKYKNLYFNILDKR